MNLKDYIHFQGKMKKEIAKEFGISRDYLYKIMTKREKPSIFLAEHISKKTGGEVTVKEIMGEDDGKGL